MKQKLLYLLSFVLFSEVLCAQTTLYDLNTIQKIEISFNQNNWDYQLDTAKLGSGNYIMAATVSINGSTYDSVGVKYKGNSSYDSTYKKNPLHIALDEFKSQSYQGFTDLKLGNGYADPSQIREVLSYSILKNYMDCPKANFAQLYINGVYYGVYSNDESINKDFCSEHFLSSNNTFIKCNPIVIPSPVTKSNLRFKPGLDSSAYFNFYEIKSATGWNDLVALCDSVTNHPNTIHTILDIDKFIWMLAFNNVLVNLDSYSGVFSQNYYLYKDNSNHFNPVIWDLNMSFGGFPFSGSGATGTGSLTVSNMQQMPLTLHSTDSYWPLIKAILNDASYKKMYVAHMRTILNEFFVNNNYQITASVLQNLIDTAVVSDTNGFYSHTQFLGALNTNYVVGSYTVPGIGNLMSARVSYLQNTPEFMAIPPTISAVNPSNLSPNLNSTVTITSSVTNASNVYLGYRFNPADKFIKISMFDDGNHNDGIAGDNIYGAAITMSLAQVQYYVYAENATAAVFSPERAEHEFYSLLINLQTPLPGQIVINEFLANNVNDAIDDNGNNSDWIELYNNTNDTLSLLGLYLSDNYSIPKKFAFPINALIYPNSFLIVWADDNSSSGTSIHCNFKLSQNGERILLCDNDTTILDSISYGPQLADQSLARCPNGLGSFVTQTQTTFNSLNCPSVAESLDFTKNKIELYPNPASETVTIFIMNAVEENCLQLKNSLDELLWNAPAHRWNQIDVSKFESGVYYLSYGSTKKKLVVINP